MGRAFLFYVRHACSFSAPLHALIAVSSVQILLKSGTEVQKKRDSLRDCRSTWRQRVKGKGATGSIGLSVTMRSPHSFLTVAGEGGLSSLRHDGFVLRHKHWLQRGHVVTVSCLVVMALCLVLFSSFYLFVTSVQTMRNEEGFSVAY